MPKVSSRRAVFAADGAVKQCRRRRSLPPSGGRFTLACTSRLARPRLMKAMLLPSALAAGPHQYLTTFLVNGTVAIDAGSLGLYGSPQDQSRVRHVFLTHAHMDHVASLPIFLENVS